MGQTHSDDTGTAWGGPRRFWLAAFVVISSCCWAAQAHAQHYGPPRTAPPPAPVVRIPVQPPTPRVTLPRRRMIMKSPGRSVEEYREPVETDPPPAPVYSWEQWNADGKVAKAKLDADLAEAQKNYLAKQESVMNTRKAEIKAARALKGQARQSAEKKAARKWSIKYDENMKEIREIRAKLWKLFYADSAKRKGRYIAARDGTPPTSPPASTTPTSKVTVAAPPPTSPPASATPPLAD